MGNQTFTIKQGRLIDTLMAKYPRGSGWTDPPISESDRMLVRQALERNDEKLDNWTRRSLEAVAGGAGSHFLYYPVQSYIRDLLSS
jgi:hypothetical protein